MWVMLVRPLVQLAGRQPVRLLLFTCIRCCRLDFLILCLHISVLYSSVRSQEWLDCRSLHHRSRGCSICC